MTLIFVEIQCVNTKAPDTSQSKYVKATYHFWPSVYVPYSCSAACEGHAGFDQASCHGFSASTASQHRKAHT